MTNNMTVKELKEMLKNWKDNDVVRVLAMPNETAILLLEKENAETANDELVILLD